MAESEKELNNLLMRVKEENEKVESEAVTDFLFLGSKITVEMTAAVKLKDICSLEGKLWQT